MPHLADMLGSLLGANLNSTADQAIPIAAGKYILRRIVVTNASGTPSLAVGGIYTAASKGGTQVVAATQVFSGLTSAPVSVDLTLAAGAIGAALTASQLFLSLTTAQGSAMTADLFIFGDALA
jgi:hypothetical protein